LVFPVVSAIIPQLPLKENAMRIFIALAMTVLMLTACGKKPNLLDNVPGSTYPRTYPTSAD
jgi:uncharacterized lipoprotein YajG